MTEEGKTNDSKGQSQEDNPQISSRRRTIYVGVVWALWICAVYTALFYSWFGFLVPFAVAQLLYVFWIRKNKLAVLPYQRQLMAWVRTTRMYDIFFRRVRGNKNLLQYRVVGLWCLVIGLIPLVLVLTDPVLDLNEMVVVRGTYESYKIVGRKNPCGDLLLTFRLENGDLIQLWSTWGLNKSYLKGLEKTKGELLTIWEEPKTTSMIPECRKFPGIAQIQSKEYQRLYDKKWYEKVNRFSLIASIFLMACGGLCLLRVLCDDGAK